MIIKDIPGLKAQLGGIQKTMYWETWEPYVRQSEMKYILPAIGQELYDELLAVEQPTADQKPLLDRLKPALAYFAYLEALPWLVTATGDQGVLINTPNNTSNISKWMYVTLNKEAGTKSDFWLENALQYLEKNRAKFATWAASDACTVSAGRLIGSAPILTAAFPSAKNSRRLFMALRDYIFKAEDEFIRPLLGEAFHDALLNKLKTAATFTVKEANVLRLARVALANNAFRKALPYINMNEDYRIVSETDGIVNEDELPADRRNLILYDCKEQQEGAVAELTRYLNANASSLIFPEYFTSDRYQPASAAASGAFPNEAGNPFFAM